MQDPFMQDPFMQDRKEGAGLALMEVWEEGPFTRGEHCPQQPQPLSPNLWPAQSKRGAMPKAPK